MLGAGVLILSSIVVLLTHAYHVLCQQQRGGFPFSSGVLSVCMTLNRKSNIVTHVSTVQRHMADWKVPASEHAHRHQVSTAIEPTDALHRV